MAEIVAVSFPVASARVPARKGFAALGTVKEPAKRKILAIHRIRRKDWPFATENELDIVEDALIDDGLMSTLDRTPFFGLHSADVDLVA